MYIYYGVFGVLFLFNIIFNNDLEIRSVGGYHCLDFIFSLRRSYYWIGLFLNSLGSILSYQNIDYKVLLRKDKSEEFADRRHRSTFTRQLLYCLLMTSLIAGFVINQKFPLMYNFNFAIQTEHHHRCVSDAAGQTGGVRC